MLAEKLSGLDGGIRGEFENRRRVGPLILGQGVTVKAIEQIKSIEGTT
jgi:hypothetical protein